MAVRSNSSDHNVSNCDGTQEYNRQTTYDPSDYPLVHRESRREGSRALVRRPSMDFVKLTKQRSRAIIENYFKGPSTPPVLVNMSKDVLNKISDTEMGKVLTRRVLSNHTHTLF